MKLELLSASNFLVHLIKLGRRNINENQLEKFRQAFVEVLRRRYRDHWFPEKPFKGSGYRCIRINGKMDPVISQAGESCGLSQALIHSTFPSELTMWIDPLEVSYRIGENGSICVLYEFKEGVSEPWRPNMNHSKSASSSGAKSSSTLVEPAKKKEKNNSGGSTCSSGSSTGSVTPPPPSSTVPCKDSLRQMDYLLDPRKSVSIEQLAAYVSS
jgi:protein Tob/BTG